MASMTHRLLYRYFVCALLLVCRYGHAQEHDKDTLFDRFREDILMEQEANNGRVVWDDETKETYYMLLRTHSAAQFAKYTDDPIPAVRAKMFSAMARKEQDKQRLRDILYRHSDDTATFIEAPTDVVMTWSVAGHMQMVVEGMEQFTSLAPVGLEAQVEKLKRDRIIFVAGARHGFIAKETLLKADSVISSLGGFRVVSFVLTVGVGAKAKRSGNILTKRAKKDISKLQRGDRIFIEQIKAAGPDAQVRIWNSIMLRIE